MKISGSKVYEYRERLKVTRTELAKASDLTFARIWQIETSEVSGVKDSCVERMAKKLKVKPEALYSETDGDLN